MRSEYKVILSGPAQSGKTKYLRMLKSKRPSRREYTPTVGAEVHPVNVETNKGDIKCMVWDTAGRSDLAGLRDGYFLQANGVIFFYNSDEQIPELDRFMTDARRVSPNAAIHVCYTGEFPTTYFPAVPLGFNLYEPLDILLRKMSGEANLMVESAC